jgi:hypothetical protein
MSKKDNLKKGFNNLLQATEGDKKTSEEVATKKETKKSKTPKRSNSQTSQRLSSQTSKSQKVAKYKELRKCTLYLPSEIMDSLAIMKIKTKLDLSELTAIALREYLVKNKFLDV